MKDLNDMNMQVSVVHVSLHKGITKNVLPDYEGILIGSRLKKIKKDKTALKKVDCVVIGTKVNLYSLISTCKHGNIKIVRRPV